jgi:hypothetical protein
MDGNNFTFTITTANDALIQIRVEKIEVQDIDRVNTEKYIRV